MNYLVAVLSDRKRADSAYAALEKAGVPMDQVARLGKEYPTADDFGLINPQARANRLSKLMSFWLVPFGFAAGFTFSLITNLDTFAWAGELGNHLVGGLLGAVSGAMGSFFIGRSSGLTDNSDDFLPYRNRLQEGKYLILVRGPESLIRQARTVLQKSKPESLQSYTDPMGV
jgi:hypothetical protein